jgi:hypothetical protein
MNWRKVALNFGFSFFGFGFDCYGNQAIKPKWTDQSFEDVMMDARGFDSIRD